MRLHAADGRLLDTLAVLPNGRYAVSSDQRGAMIVYPLFESFAEMTAAGNRMVIGHGSKAELSVYVFDPGPALTRIVRWSTGDLEVTQADVDADHRRLEQQYADMTPDMRRRFLDPLISDHRLVADRFPAFVGVTIARDGRLWIRTYPRPDERAVRHWIGFDADGRFACRLDLPTGLDVYEVAADYLLGKTRDEDGVERVVRYALTGP